MNIRNSVVSILFIAILVMICSWGLRAKTENTTSLKSPPIGKPKQELVVQEKGEVSTESEHPSDTLESPPSNEPIFQESTSPSNIPGGIQTHPLLEVKKESTDNPEEGQVSFSKAEFLSRPFHTRVSARLVSIRKVVETHNTQLSAIADKQDPLHAAMKPYLATLITLERQLSEALEGGDINRIEEADKKMVTHVARNFPGGASKANCNCCGIEKPLNIAKDE